MTHKKPIKKPAKSGKTVLVLRICNTDGTSSHGFTWPKRGPVKCSDWKPTEECGNGLHGWLWGSGDHSAANWGGERAWLVVRVLESDVIRIGAKVKFPKGEVILFGSQADATALLIKEAPAGTAIIGAAINAGDLGTAHAGDRGTAHAGYRGTAHAGETGILLCSYWDGNRMRILVGYVGEDGIQKGRPYHAEGGRIIPGEHPEAKASAEYAAKLTAMEPKDRT